jgi:DNA-binding PadR family transcriptional regulator
VRLDPLDFLPLKDLVFRILVMLADGERHGWDLVQSLDDSARATRLLPGHLYRTLDRMLEDGLIEERDQSSTVRKAPGARGAAPSRFFRLTPLGRDVARAETRRLEALIGKALASNLLRERR